MHYSSPSGVFVDRTWVEWFVLCCDRYTILDRVVHVECKFFVGGGWWCWLVCCFGVDRVVLLLLLFLFPFQVLKVDLTHIQLAFSVTSITGPLAGVFFGGWLVDKMGGYADDPSATAKTLFTCNLFGVGAVLCAIPTAFVDSFVGAVALIWLILFFGGALLPALTGVCLTSVRNVQMVIVVLVSFSFLSLCLMLFVFLGWIVVCVVFLSFMATGPRKLPFYCVFLQYVYVQHIGLRVGSCLNGWYC